MHPTSSRIVSRSAALRVRPHSLVGSRFVIVFSHRFVIDGSYFTSSSALCPALPTSQARKMCITT
jgi:hypothetical protein